MTTPLFKWLSLQVVDNDLIFTNKRLSSRDLEFLQSKILETEAGDLSAQPWILLAVPDGSLLRLTGFFLLISTMLMQPIYAEIYT